MSPDAASVPGPLASPAQDLARFDWRFLLSHPWPDRVGWFGREVPPALRLLAQVELVGASTEPSHPQGLLRLVVASNATDAELVRATKHVAPGGSLIVEVQPRSSGTSDASRGRGPTTLGAVTRRLRDLGFAEVRAHWHWPDLERCTRIVPLADRAPIRNALMRAGSGLRTRLQGHAANLLLNLGLLDRVVLGSVIAIRSPETSPGRATPVAVRANSFVHRFLIDRSREDGVSKLGIGPNAPFLALTPRFRNSSHLVFLLFAGDADAPAIAVKLARRAGRSQGLEEEADRLRAIHALRSGGFVSIPRVIACEVFEGHALLAETALTGRAMDPARVRADAADCCAAIVDWMIEVQTPSRRDRPAGDSWILQRIERDLGDLQSAGLADPELCESTRRVVRPLASHAIPSVLEHGDLSHPNILLSPSGAAAVLDWELSEPIGLPATDLCFFLAYVARARAQAMTGPSAASAIVDAFAGAPEWLRAPLARYCTGLSLPEAALPGLCMAGWVTQAAAVVRRAPAHALAAESAELRADWRVDVWRRVAASPDRLLGGA